MTSLAKRIRWGIENNQVDDAFKVARLGDLAADIVARSTYYRLDLAELFFKAQNYPRALQYLEEVLATRPDTLEANRAIFLRGRIKEVQKDLQGAYRDYRDLANHGYKPDQTWYRCGLISLYWGNLDRAKEELNKAVVAGSRFACEKLAGPRCRCGAHSTWNP